MNHTFGVRKCERIAHFAEDREQAFEGMLLLAIRRAPSLGSGPRVGTDKPPGPKRTSFSTRSGLARAHSSAT